MINFMRHRKKGKMIEEPITVQIKETKSIEENLNAQINEDLGTEDEIGHKARDLMILISKAIDEWANMYEMQELPKDFIFEQALGIMNTVNRNKKIMERIGKVIKKQLNSFLIILSLIHIFSY